MTLAGHVASLVLVILVPGAILIAMLKLGWLRGLRIPIDGGARLAGQPLFGETKTWLGVLIYVIGAMLVGAALGASDWAEPLLTRGGPIGGAAIGTWIGLAYVAGELINSFVKRRLGIGSSSVAPGAVAGGVQRAIDLADGALAVCVVLLLLGVDGRVVLLTLIAGLAAHALTDVVMKLLRLRRSDAQREQRR